MFYCRLFTKLMSQKFSLSFLSFKSLLILNTNSEGNNIGSVDLWRIKSISTRMRFCYVQNMQIKLGEINIISSLS